jgi:hypothetical protein
MKARWEFLSGERQAAKQHTDAAEQQKDQHSVLDI